MGKLVTCSPGLEHARQHLDGWACGSTVGPAAGSSIPGLVMGATATGPQEYRNPGQPEVVTKNIDEVFALNKSKGDCLDIGMAFSFIGVVLKKSHAAYNARKICECQAESQSFRLA